MYDQAHIKLRLVISCRKSRRKCDGIASS